MHKKALEKMKNIMDEFCAIQDPTCEQADLFKMTMCGYKEYIDGEYKATIIDEMKKAKEEEELMSKMGMNDRMGYNRHRDSMGRFTSRNYRPYMDMNEEDYMSEYLESPAMFKDNMRMGYHGSYSANGGGSQTGGRMGYDSNHAKSYEDYRHYRRNYTETKDPENHRKMKSKMSEVFEEIEDMATDMVNDMTPEEKTKYNQKLTDIAQKFK